MVATAVIIAGGFIAAAQTTSLLWTYITYGIIVGFGVGVGTDCVMSVAVKWYPDKQGIASGGMLMGFGMGAMLLSPLVTVLLGQFSWQTTFLILGVVFGVVMLAVAFIVKLPPVEFVASMHVAKAADESGNQKRDYSLWRWSKRVRSGCVSLADSREQRWSWPYQPGGTRCRRSAFRNRNGRRRKRHDGNGRHGRHLFVQRFRTTDVRSRMG